MIGAIVNAGAILVGGFIGLFGKRELSAQSQHVLKLLLGVITMVNGFRFVWLNLNGTFLQVVAQFAIVVAALVMGKLIGKLLGLQKQLNRLGRDAKERFARAQAGTAPGRDEGFITCTILFCVNPLALLGALQDGLSGDFTTLLIKAAVDGLSMLSFARIFGASTLLTAVPVLAYQGTLTLLAQLVRPRVISVSALDALGATSGLLVAITALVMLDVRKIRIADYLPALLVVPFLHWLLR